MSSTEVALPAGLQKDFERAEAEERRIRAAKFLTDQRAALISQLVAHDAMVKAERERLKEKTTGPAEELKAAQEAFKVAQRRLERAEIAASGSDQTANSNHEARKVQRLRILQRLRSATPGLAEFLARAREELFELDNRAPDEIRHHPSGLDTHRRIETISNATSIGVRRLAVVALIREVENDESLATEPDVAAVQKRLDKLWDALPVIQDPVAPPA